jgi:hypothetical protein
MSMAIHANVRHTGGTAKPDDCWEGHGGETAGRMFPINTGHGRTKPACWLGGGGTEAQPLKETSPTGLAFTCLVGQEGLGQLPRILKNACLQSEIEPLESLMGLAVFNWDLQKKLPGGFSMKCLEELEEWWFQWNPLKAALKWDSVFRSDVIGPDLFRETTHFYHRMNFCLLSQIFGSAIPGVKQKMLDYAQSPKHQASVRNRL